jgi:hypothetical protein
LASAYTVTLGCALTISGVIYSIRDKTEENPYEWFYPHGTVASLVAFLPFSLPVLVQIPHVLGYQPLEDKVLNSHYDVAVETVEISRNLGLNKSTITVEICSEDQPFKPCTDDYLGSVYKNIAGMYIVSLNKDKGGNSSSVLRHELIHIANGDCDERFEEVINFSSPHRDTINYLSVLKEELWDDPVADLYALYGLQL